MERLATGFGFTEGPLWHPDGFLSFVDFRRSHLLRWQSGKGVEVMRENTDEGNNLTFDRQGCLVMFEGGNRWVMWTEADGSVMTLAERYQGKLLNRPNDPAHGPDPLCSAACTADGSPRASSAMVPPCLPDPAYALPLESSAR